MWRSQEPQVGVRAASGRCRCWEQRIDSCTLLWVVTVEREDGLKALVVVVVVVVVVVTSCGCGIGESHG
jgi:hypothetical protein